MEAVKPNQSIDETKEKLRASKERLEAELEYQFQDAKADLIDLGKKALIYGGGAYLTYKLLKAAFKKKSRKRYKVEETYLRSNQAPVVYQEKKAGVNVGQMLSQQLITILTLIAKEQLTRILESKLQHGKKSNFR